MDSSSRSVLAVFAFVGAVVLCAFINSLLPESSVGWALRMAVFVVAMYPTHRLTWLKPQNAWRYWLAAPFAVLAAGVFTPIAQRVPAHWNAKLGMATVLLATVASLIAVFQALARRERK